MSAAPDLSPFPDLASAARGTMQYLQSEMGFGKWMFTNFDGANQIILDTLGREYPIEAGLVIPWPDTFCSHMVAGDGPMIAERAMEVPAYAAVPLGPGIRIESYVGIPIYRNDGSLFGTMCAIDTHPATDIERFKPLIELIARMLGFAVDRQGEADDASRRADRAESEALIDGLTGIYNRKGWDYLVSREEDRCRQYGYPACAFVVDLDGFKEINDTLGHAVGDRVLQSVAACLKRAFRSVDVIARTGGDEFSVLAIECDGSEGERLLSRVNDVFSHDSIAASVGLGYRPAARLVEVWKAADDAMYLAKRGREPRHVRAS